MSTWLRLTNQTLWLTTAGCTVAALVTSLWFGVASAGYCVFMAVLPGPFTVLAIKLTGIFVKWPGVIVVYGMLYTMMLLVKLFAR